MALTEDLNAIDKMYRSGRMQCIQIHHFTRMYTKNCDLFLFLFYLGGGGGNK